MKNTYVSVLLVCCILFSLFGCAKKTYTPALETNFDLKAKYTFSDFSYVCRIVRKNGAVIVTPLSTRAAGMSIKYDGRNVFFTRNGMTKRFCGKDVDPANPAVVVYDVFSSIENSQRQNVKLKNSCFCYSGSTRAGKFTLVQSKSNKIKSILLADSKIEINFDL